MMHRLLLPGGTYDCRWSYDGQRLPGDVSLEGSQRPRGRISTHDIWEQRLTRGNGVGFPQVERRDELRGALDNGTHAVAIDANLLHQGPEKSQIDASMLVVGVNVPKELLFHSVEFQVGGLTELAGVHPIAKVFIPNTSLPDAEGRIKWDTQAATQQWTTGDGTEFSLRFTPTWNNDGYSFALKSMPTVTISISEPRPADWWLNNYVRPLAEITSLSTVRDQSVSWVMLSHGERKHPIQLFTSDIDQSPYEAARPAAGDLINGQGGLIELGPSGLGLPVLLERWHSLAARHPVFHDHLAASLRRGMTMRANFLSVVSALEGFHTVKEGDNDDANAEFERKRAAAVADVTAAHRQSVIASKTAKFIKQHLRKERPPRPLDQRLRQIATKELSDGMAERIQRRFPTVPGSLMPFSKSTNWDIWSVAAEVRNRMAHGDGLQPSEAGLSTLAYLTNTVAVALALNQLGIGDQVLCQAIDEQQWRVS